MQTFRVLTLVDITKTGIQKEKIDPLKKKQQDNYQTLLQTLEMRANIFTEDDPIEITMDWSNLGYGKKERTWVWNFYIEQDDIFRINDINYIPFNTECNETAKFKQNFFSASIKPINIIFESVDK